MIAEKMKTVQGRDIVRMATEKPMSEAEQGRLLKIRAANLCHHQLATIRRTPSVTNLAYLDTSAKTAYHEHMFIST